MYKEEIIGALEEILETLENCFNAEEDVKILIARLREEGVDRVEDITGEDD